MLLWLFTLIITGLEVSDVLSGYYYYYFYKSQLLWDWGPNGPEELFEKQIEQSTR